MEAASRERNLVVMGVYWLLTAIAVLFLIGALWQVNRIRSIRPLQIRVLERTVRLEVRELSGKRGTHKALFGIAKARLERSDSRGVTEQQEEFSISRDELVSHSFLDLWEPGVRRPAVEVEGKLILDPPNPWLIAGVLGVCAWLFGAFGWIAKSAIDGGGMGLRVLALALIPAGVAAYGVGTKMARDNAEKSLQRVPVEGTARQLTAAEAVRELATLGVTGGADVVEFLGGADASVNFAEYPFRGRMFRAVSLWCQPAAGESCAGRLNPGNSRDVKWGAEP